MRINRLSAVVLDRKFALFPDAALTFSDLVDWVVSRTCMVGYARKLVGNFLFLSNGFGSVIYLLLIGYHNLF